MFSISLAHLWLADTSWSNVNPGLSPLRISRKYIDKSVVIGKIRETKGLFLILYEKVDKNFMFFFSKKKKNAKRRKKGFAYLQGVEIV